MSDFADVALGALVLVPLLGAAMTVLSGQRVRRALALGVSTVTAASVLPVVSSVRAGEVPVVALGDFDAPLGIHLRADGLSAIFLALTALVGIAVTVYAAATPASTGKQLSSSDTKTAQWTNSHPAFWPLWLACWAGLNAVFISGDLFNTYVGIELVGLTAIALIALGGPAAWKPALRYLFIAITGSLLFLVGVALIVSATGTLDIQQAAAAIVEMNRSGDPGDSDIVIGLAVILMTIGLAMKVALVPMHRWLIPAHANAPGAVSPIMSALVIKVALFVILRLWFWLVEEPGPLLTGAGWLLGILGVLALVTGSIMALRQSHLKPLIAYSTVAQVGFWFLMFPVLVTPDAGNIVDRSGTELAESTVISSALAATVMLAVGHALAKATLFLAAGFLKDAYGTDEITQLHGAGRQHPLLLMAMGLSAIGLVGLPVSLSFSGKWELATIAVSAGHYWILAVLVIATLLSAAYMLKVLSPLLVEADDDLPHRTTTHTVIREQSAVAPAVPFILGILVLVTGFGGVWISDLLSVGGVGQ